MTKQIKAAVERYNEANQWLKSTILTVGQSKFVDGKVIETPEFTTRKAEFEAAKLELNSLKVAAAKCGTLTFTQYGNDARFVTTAEAKAKAKGKAQFASFLRNVDR